MLLISMIALLFLFSLLGMEIAWAIGLAAFGYLTLSQFSDNATPMVLFAQQMTPLPPSADPALALGPISQPPMMQVQAQPQLQRAHFQQPQQAQPAPQQNSNAGFDDFDDDIPF